MQELSSKNPPNRNLSLPNRTTSSKELEDQGWRWRKLKFYYGTSGSDKPRNYSNET